MIRATAYGERNATFFGLRRGSADGAWNWCWPARRALSYIRFGVITALTQLRCSYRSDGASAVAGGSM